jgi:HK97 gp10 family phage protein
MEQSILRQLRDFPPALKSDLQEVGRFVADRVRIAAPMRTGALRQHIGPLAKGPGQMAIVAGKFYARFLEFGTKKMRPHVFFRPAIKDGIAEFERQAERRMQQVS